MHYRWDFQIFIVFVNLKMPKISSKKTWWRWYVVFSYFQNLLVHFHNFHFYRHLETSAIEKKKSCCCRLIASEFLRYLIVKWRREINWNGCHRFLIFPLNVNIWVSSLLERQRTSYHENEKRCWLHSFTNDDEVKCRIEWEKCQA